MPTNGLDDELVVLPPNNDINHVFNVRNQVIYTLFYKVTLGYARIFPRSLRKCIEFLLLLKAVFSFFLLVYVHVHFSRMPANCLEHVKDIWPRDGILRVEIIRPHQRFFAEQTGTLDDLFTIEKSYKRELKLKQLNTTDKNDYDSRFIYDFTKINNLENEGDVDIELSPEEIIGNNYGETSTPKTNFLFNYISFLVHGNIKDDKKEIYSSTTSNWNLDMSESNFLPVNDSAQFCSTKYSNSSFRGISGIDTNLLINSTTTKPLPNDENESMSYIVEYSLEYGYLRLSPNARSRLGIPVMLVSLEPTVHKCFGDSINQIFFEHLLGYDDLLISSVKSLLKNDQNKGYLRSVNLITKKHNKFVSIWEAITSCIASFFIMIVFTMSLSMLLRYSHDQIFIFIVNVQQRLEFHESFTFSAALLITIILALLGMEATLSEYFNDVLTELYVVITVWLADQYDIICSHCSITKRHWLKFFYLYQFSFYAYHYRFNGYYNNLALICSWFFIQHSMVYFYHNYELPYILQQAQLQQQQQEQEQEEEQQEQEQQ